MLARMVTDEEREQWSLFWKKHEESLDETGTVSKGSVRYLNVLTQPDWIGYGVGKIRPGMIGKVDVYFIFINLSRTVVESLTLSGLLEEFKRYCHSAESCDDEEEDVRRFIQSKIDEAEKCEEVGLASCSQAA